MTSLPALTGVEIVKALVKAGFQIIRQKGSHVKLAHLDGRITVIPVHKGESIGKGLMSKILRDIDLSKEEFYSLL
jgi:predicted RNA binding protein YcfA (HicA-like mRNA interferase family)